MAESANSVFIERQRKDIDDAMLLVPPMDILESAEGYCVYCSLAGVGRDDISLGLEDGMLVVNAKARLAKLPGKIHALEFVDAVFKGKVELPRNVDTSAISAMFSNGLLKVLLPYMARKNERIIIQEG